jgi:hypothetical protein
MLKELISYLENDLNVQPDVAVTIVLSLFTFSLGYLITWSAAAVARIIKRKNYKKSLKVIIRNFLDSCQKQYLLLEDHKDQRGFLQGENFVFTIKTNFGQNYLSTLDIKTFI